MINRDVHLKDPLEHKLANNGVANVNDNADREALRVLRYELETFVCEGQYEKGMVDILDTYLRNIDQPQQPAVWVSGFYGSGKSHLVKMLRALWVDTEFEDGATARGVANLPISVKDLLRELSTQGRRYGGLHAASGTLGAGSSGSVRLALLRLVFRSVGLPEQFPIARFVMWLKQEGIYQDVREDVSRRGFDWEDELDNFYVAEGLHQALVTVKPSVFASVESCAETLNNMYPYVSDISSSEMVKAVRQALSRERGFPLTLLVVDEVQQYIGEDGQRSTEVQEVVEACCKNLGGKLLFVGTGQTAVTGTTNLKKLEGRFTVRVELSDSDVEAVIRKVILAKKPDARTPIRETMEQNLGEISRHLTGTSLAHRQEDVARFDQDYPVLPVRRRFWEATLRVLDRTGTDSQLRNQLTMVHRAVQRTASDPLGYVIPADFLYFDLADRLLQSRMLPRRVYENTMTWINGSDSDKLRARACGLVFLVNKLAASNPEVGIRATADTLADLMVEDLAQGSSSLRSRLPELLDKCDLLMKVGDEYRIQTPESAAWHNEFESQRAILANEAYRIEAERDDRIEKQFTAMVGKLPLSQGESKVERAVHLEFGSELPPDSSERVCVWVRTGWSTDEQSVKADARKAGNDSPTVFVFVPRRSTDDLRRCLIDYKAACATLERRGVNVQGEAAEARDAMETTRSVAEAKIGELLNEALSGAKVYQGGGNEVAGADLRSAVLEAARNAVCRLYPQFGMADHPGWSKVYEKAREGAPDALRAIGFTGEVASNPVCRTLLGAIGSGTKGLEIRKRFESAPYGWSGDAIDGGLQVLLVAGLVRAQDDRGHGVDPRNLERRSIGKTTFRVESATVTTAQRLEIRRLIQKLGLSARPSEEHSQAASFLDQMKDLATKAGGEKPKPPVPDTSLLDRLRHLTGNEQLLGIYDHRKELSDLIDTWTDTATHIEERWPEWVTLKSLISHASGLPGSDRIQAQVRVIEEQRQLLAGPNPMVPLVADLTQILRDELNAIAGQWDEHWNKGENRLVHDVNWRSLTQAQQGELRSKHGLSIGSRPRIAVQDTEAILETLAATPGSVLRDRTAAMPARFDRMILEAARLVEPDVQEVEIPRRTLKDLQDVSDWIDDVRNRLETAIKNGPIVIR